MTQMRDATGDAGELKDAIIDDLLIQSRQFRVQRDELLAALEEILDAPRGAMAGIAREAIAKAKGSTP